MSQMLDDQGWRPEWAAELEDSPEGIVGVISRTVESWWADEQKTRQERREGVWEVIRGDELAGGLFVAHAEDRGSGPVALSPSSS